MGGARASPWSRATPRYCSAQSTRSVPTTAPQCEGIAPPNHHLVMSSDRPAGWGLAPAKTCDQVWPALPDIGRATFRNAECRLGSPETTVPVHLGLAPGFCRRRSAECGAQSTCREAPTRERSVLWPWAPGWHVDRRVTPRQKTKPIAGNQAIQSTSGLGRARGEDKRDMNHPVRPRPEHGPDGLALAFPVAARLHATTAAPHDLGWFEFLPRRTSSAWP
jgi:hypothetical protein